MHEALAHRALAIVAAACLAAAAASTVLAAPAEQRHLTLTLDWTPNPDHVGFYYARDKGLFAKAGLDVAIRSPSDPSAALKLVAVGRTDLAVSYEPELFYAAARKLPVVAVAAVVPRPLNSIMTIDPGLRRVADLRGHTVGITGVPSDYAALDTALAGAGLTRKAVTVVNVGYNLLPALLSHKVDAVLGVYRNVEAIELEQRGVKPTVIPLDRAGIPPYDELVLVASKKRLAADAAYADAVRRFVGAFVAGTNAARRDPKGALEVLRRATAAKDAFLERATPATLRLLAGAGCPKPARWARYGRWMRAHGLLKKPVATSAVVTRRYCAP